MTARLYQAIYTWALKRWRKQLPKHKDLHSPRPKITEHALVRYFERIKGYDMDEVRDKILSPQARDNIKLIGGNGKFVSDGMLYIVVKGVVVTLAKPNKGQAIWSGLHKSSKIPRKWSF